MTSFESKCKRPMWILAFALTALVVGCGGGDSGGGDGAPGGATGPAAVPLGAATTFGAGSGAGITNQGTSTVVNGDLGTFAASTSVTGFHDLSMAYTPPDGATGCTYTETTSNIGLVTGGIYTSTPPPTVECAHEGTDETVAYFTAAANDLSLARAELNAMAAGADPGANLGGLTLAPGVYATSSGAFEITGSDLTLDAQGNPDAFWVFQTASTLTVGDTAPRSVILVNGAHPKNVYWRIGSAATINGAGGGTMVGNIIADSAVTFSTIGNADVTILNGRAFSSAGMTMVDTVINVPAP